MRGLLAFGVLFTALAGAQEAAFLVGEKINGSVGFYAADGKRLGGVRVGEHPHELVLSPDGKYAYITDNGILWMTYAGPGGNTVSIIDVAAREKAGVIDLGDNRRPHGIDVDRKTGNLIVTTENPDGLLLIDPVARKILRKYDVRGSAPHMTILDAGAEWAYVSNTNSNAIAAIHMKTGEAKVIPTGPGPQGCVFSHDGKLLYVTNGRGSSIAIVDTAKKERIGEIPTGKTPVRIALTPDGKTLVYALQDGEAVGFADIATRKEVHQVALTGRPLSLTTSRDGKLAYAAVQDQDKIFEISVPDRKLLRIIQIPRGLGPDPVIPLR